MKQRNVQALLLSSVLTLGAFSAHAVNLIELNEGKSTMLQISLAQPTLIRGQGVKLKEITVADTSATISKDSMGNAVLTPLTPEPFTVYVTLDSGEIANLLLVPRKIPGDSIVINKPANSQLRSIQSEMEFTQALKYMLFIAVTGDEISGVTKKRVGKEVKLWREVRFIHEATHEARDIVAVTDNIEAAAGHRSADIVGVRARVSRHDGVL